MFPDVCAVQGQHVIPIREGEHPTAEGFLSGAVGVAGDLHPVGQPRAVVVEAEIPVDGACIDMSGHFQQQSRQSRSAAGIRYQGGRRSPIGREMIHGRMGRLRA